METEPLRKLLAKYGWHAEDGSTWKNPLRPDQEIILPMPTGWVLLKLDITAPNDYEQVAGGITGAELELYLRSREVG